MKKTSPFLVMSLMVLWCYLSCILSTSAQPGGVSASFADVVEKASGSVVFISTEEGTGSGFYVNADGYVVTARHVVRLRDHSLAKAIYLRQSVSAAVDVHHNSIQAVSNEIGATLIGEDEEHDLALLKPKTDPFRARALLNGQDVLPSRHPATLCKEGFPLRSGENIFTVGHPLGDLRRITTAGIIASSEATEIDESCALRGTYVVDMVINHGNSGGPVFSATGCVIGVADAITLTGVEGKLGGSSVPHITLPLAGPDGKPLTDPNGRPLEVALEYGSGLGVLIPQDYVLKMINRAGLSAGLTIAP